MHHCMWEGVRTTCVMWWGCLTRVIPFPYPTHTSWFITQNWNEMDQHRWLCLWRINAKPKTQTKQSCQSLIPAVHSCKIDVSNMLDGLNCSIKYYWIKWCHLVDMWYVMRWWNTYWMRWCDLVIKRVLYYL